MHEKALHRAYLRQGPGMEKTGLSTLDRRCCKKLRGSLSWTRVTPLEIRNGQILVTKAVETDYSSHGVGSSEV